MRSPRSLFLVALALLVATACATTQEAPKSEVPRSPTFFWKVTSEDKPGTVYLLGTVHLGDPTEATLDGAVLDAVDAADRLVFELAPDEENQAHIMAETQRLGFLPEGESLRALVDEETSAGLERVAAKVGLPLVALERMRPWVAALTLSVLHMQLEGHSQEAGTEQLLLARAARAGGKETHDLETPDEQLRLFADLSLEAQLEMLRDSLEDIEAEGSAAGEIQAAYRSGDDERLRALLFEGRGKDPNVDELYRALFDDRNVRMVERLQRFFDEKGSTVVAVGTGHMLGERGIPALLAAKGYRVEGVAPLGQRPVGLPEAQAASAFSDEALGFVAEFHATPQRSDHEMAGPEGHDWHFTVVTASARRLDLTVVVNQFPGPLPTDSARVDPMLDGMIARIAGQIGTLESSERLRLWDLPAARFTATSPTQRVNGLLVLRGAHAYTAVATRSGQAEGAADEAREEAVRRFFESFQLLELPAPEEPAPEAEPASPEG